MWALAAAALLALVVTATAATANGEPKRAFTKADLALARSVVLVRADLGDGFVGVRRADQDLPDGARCGPLAESDLTITGKADSPDFRLQQTGVLLTAGSSAHVYRTLREANASFTRGTGKQVATCLADIVRLSSPPGQKIRVRSAKRVAFPSLAPKTAAYRVVASVSAGSGQSVTVYFDAIVLQQGRVQASLVFTSAGRPLAETDRVVLASVVAKRLARAAGRPTGPVA